MNLLDYIKGLRKGKNARKIELDAMHDPFLSEAIEGYDSVHDDHVERILRMQNKIADRSGKNKNRTVPWSVAAGLLICISIGGYFWMNHQPQNEYIAGSKIEKKQPEIETGISTEKIIEQVVTPEVVVKEKKNLPDVQMKAEDDMRTMDEIYVSELPQPIVKSQIQEKPFPTEIDIPEKTVSIILEGKVAGVSVHEAEITGDIYNFTSKHKYNVTGKVVDSSGEPLIGASVNVKGKTDGTITDTSGYFNLSVDKKDKDLVVQYLGYEPLVLPKDTVEPMLFALNESRQALSEVVVIGYGTTKKSTITGSVAQIDEKSVKATKPEPLIGKKLYDKYLKNNLIQPSDSICKDKKGNVVVEFFVDASGNPYNFTIKKSLCQTADSEAIRIIKEGSRWTTGGSKPVEITVKFK